MVKNYNREAASRFAEGLNFHKQGKLAEAQRIYEELLSFSPKHFDALHLLGVVEYQNKNYIRAIELIGQAIAINPNFAAAYANLGAALVEVNQHEQALESYDQAIGLEPDNVEAWFNRGNVLGTLRRYERAIASYERAIDLEPDYAQAWLNRGIAFREVNYHEKAIAALDKAIDLKPDFAEAWLNRGNVLVDIKQFQKAIVCYKTAIELRPKYAVAWSNLGSALGQNYESEQALSAFDKAIELQLDYAAPWSMRGNVLKAMGRFTQAVESYREAIRIEPEFLAAHSNLLFSLNYIAGLSTQEALDEAKRFGSKVSEKAKPKFTTWGATEAVEKLRVGFVSGDLKNHPVGFFVEGLIERLDRNYFEIYAFPTTSTKDDLTRRIKPFFHKWAPIYGITNQEAASLIHQENIHILIDLSGHSGDNRLAVFSYKPAPVQVSWLGYFATTGLPEMDYFLSDPHLSPMSDPGHFTEKLWRLADTWLCLKPPVHGVPVSPLPALENGFLTFGSFGNLSKMNDEVVETWSSVLHGVSASKLFLKSKQFVDFVQVQEVKTRFEKYDISSDRLILEGPETLKGYFEAYQKVDIILDTFPYPGGTTSVDSLWMGVPVLTLKGDRFLSRLGESIAINAGNSDWIAADLNDYIGKAVQFASDLDRLAQLRSTLRERVLRSPLFDTLRFAKNFGKALWGMWNQPPSTKF